MTSFPDYRPLRLEPFDREKSFVVRQPMKVNGKIFSPGDILEKELLTTRRLRQLYEQRRVAMSDFEPAGPSAGAKPVFEKMTTQSIREWLQGNKVIPRENSKRANLINLANITWEKAHGVPA